MSYQAIKRHAGNFNACYSVKETYLKDCMPHGSSYAPFGERQNYGVRKKIRGCLELGWKERRMGGTWRIFKAEKLFRRILSWWVCVMIHLPNPLNV